MIYKTCQGIARSGFEPLSQAPKARMLDRYTTGLSINPAAGFYTFRLGNSEVFDLLFYMI